MGFPDLHHHRPRRVSRTIRKLHQHDAREVVLRVDPAFCAKRAPMSEPRAVDNH